MFLQVVQSKVVNENLERKLRANSQYLANLEARLQHEIVKAAPLLNANLDALPTPQLQQLVNAQEEALKRARSMLVGHLTLVCLHTAVAMWPMSGMLHTASLVSEGMCRLSVSCTQSFCLLLLRLIASWS